MFTSSMPKLKNILRRGFLGKCIGYSEKALFFNQLVIYGRDNSCYIDRYMCV